VTQPLSRQFASDSDEDLVRDLAMGRHEALGPLYGRYAGLIFNIAVQSLDRTSAEEVVQETFLAVWRGASTFDPAQGSFRPWALRIAHWRVLNELRRRRRRPLEETAGPAEPDSTSDAERTPLLRLADPDPGPEDRAADAERADTIRSALETLTPKQRQAVALAFMEDLTHEQVADTLGVPLGTAKTRIRDGVGHMRRMLAPIAASLVLVAGLAAGLIKYLDQERTLGQNQRAVGVLTSSEVVPIRVLPVPSVAALWPDMHATYRSQPGTGLVVLSMSHAPAQQTYQASAHIGGKWQPIGTLSTDQDGRAVMIAEGDVWATAPDAIQVTTSPGDQPVLTWSADAP
jgi:RNA polymerase sigma-70 factor (ECF subfamily)